jgi:hypothetical protein
MAAVTAQVALFFGVRIGGTATAHGSASPPCTSAANEARQAGYIVEVLAGNEAFVVEGSPLYRVVYGHNEESTRTEIVRSGCAGTVKLLAPRGTKFGAGERLAIVKESDRPIVVGIVASAYLVDLAVEPGASGPRGPRTIRVGTREFGVRLIGLAPFSNESDVIGSQVALSSGQVFRVAFELTDATATEISAGAPITFDVSLRPRTLAEWMFG